MSCGTVVVKYFIHYIRLEALGWSRQKLNSFAYLAANVASKFSRIHSRHRLLKSGPAM